jgi:hypothetical protein
MSTNFNRAPRDSEDSQEQKVVPINPKNSASFKKDSFSLRDAAKNAIKNPLVAGVVGVVGTVGFQNAGNIKNYAETLVTPSAPSAIETATENNTTAAQRFAEAQKITLASVYREKSEAETAHIALTNTEVNAATAKASLEVANANASEEKRILSTAPKNVSEKFDEKTGEVTVTVTNPDSSKYAQAYKNVLLKKGLVLKAEQVLAAAKATDAKETMDVPAAEAKAKATLSEASQNATNANAKLEAIKKADQNSTQAFEVQGSEAKAVNEKYSAEFYKILATRATKNADASYTSTDSKFITQAAKAAAKNNMKYRGSADGLTISF